jgi:two-component system, chemotaxis family, protein-glutamate methylesterase/glutaminase
MPKRDIIVIGTSAGGVEALSRLVATLPANFPAAIFVTVHFPRTSQSTLPQILSRAGKLPALHPDDGQVHRPGHVYVAPPDRHMLLIGNAIRLVRGPTENGNRPAVDVMFRSAALAYRERVIGVVLTGNLDDGTAGLYAIVRRGGIGVAQDPSEAIFPSMPRSAIEHGLTSHVVPLEELGALLQRLVAEELPVHPEVSMPDDAPRENAFAAFDIRAMEDPDNHPGEPSPYACPDCGGVLWEIVDGEMERFRCRVGHAWTSDALLMQQNETLDSALWMALRALEESVSLNRRVAERLRQRGNSDVAGKFERASTLAERRAMVIRDALMPPRSADDASPAGDAATAPLGIAASGRGRKT